MTDPLHELSRDDLYKFATQMEATVKALQLALEHEQNNNIDVLAKNIEFVKSNANLAKEVNSLMHQYRTLEAFTNKILQTHHKGNDLIAEWNKSHGVQPAPDPKTLSGEPNFFDIDKIDGNKK